MSQIEDQFKVLPASIGGAAFQMHVSKQDVGRRRALQEYPNTDFVTEQDLGAQADDFTITGHIAGSDYLRKKKALRDVFAGVGPFLLVHPFEGRFLVKVEGRLSIEEDAKKLGWAEVSFKCKRATRDDINRVTVDPATTATSAVTSARSASATSAAAQVSRLDVSTVQAAFRTKIGVVKTALASSVGAVLDATDTTGAAIVASVNSLTTVTDGLLTSPLELFASIASTVRGVVKAPFVVSTTAETTYAALSDGDRILAMLGIAGRFVRLDEIDLEPLTEQALSGEPSDADTDAQAIARNAQALTACLRAEAAAAIVEAVLVTKPDSTTQAADILERVNQLMLGEVDGDPDALLFAVDADSLVALSDLRAALTRYLASLTSLPTIETYEVPARTNAIMLAQLLLGDATRYDEIVSRNQLSDPMFIAAGTEIEYLRAA